MRSSGCCGRACAAQHSWVAPCSCIQVRQCRCTKRLSIAFILLFAENFEKQQSWKPTMSKYGRIFCSSARITTQPADHLRLTFNGVTTLPSHARANCFPEKRFTLLFQGKCVFDWFSLSRKFSSDWSLVEKRALFNTTTSNDQLLLSTKKSACLWCRFAYDLFFNCFFFAKICAFLKSTINLAGAKSSWERETSFKTHQPHWAARGSPSNLCMMASIKASFYDSPFLPIRINAEN